MKVNPESSPEHAAVQQQHGITAYPTIIFLSSEGDSISVVPGYRDAEQFAPVMEEVLQGEEKLQQLHIAVQKQPDDPQTNAELALIYVKRGKLEKGQPFVDKALALDSENKTGLLPDIYLNLGLHYGMNVGDENAEEYYQKAENHFSTIIEKYPQAKAYESAQYYLGVTYALQQKYQPAIATLEKLKAAKDSDIKEVAMSMLENVKRSMAEASK